MICRQLEVFVRFALLKDIIVSHFNKGVGNVIVSNLRSCRVIRRAVLSYHNTRRDADEVGFFPVFLLQKRNAYWFALFINVIVFAIDHKVERYRIANILALARVKRIFPYLKGIQFFLCEANRIRVCNFGNVRF